MNVKAKLLEAISIGAFAQASRSTADTETKSPCTIADACFALFRRLMSHPKLRMEDMFKPGLPLLLKTFTALRKLTQRHAQQCYQKFEELGIEYAMFAQTWFMTLFTYSMDWGTCGPVWDVFLNEVGKVRFALLCT